MSFSLSNRFVCSTLPVSASLYGCICPTSLISFNLGNPSFSFRRFKHSSPQQQSVNTTPSAAHAPSSPSPSSPPSSSSPSSRLIYYNSRVTKYRVCSLLPAGQIGIFSYVTSLSYTIGTEAVPLWYGPSGVLAGIVIGWGLYLHAKRTIQSISSLDRHSNRVEIVPHSLFGFKSAKAIAVDVSRIGHEAVSTFRRSNQGESWPIQLPDYRGFHMIEKRGNVLDVAAMKRVLGPYVKFDVEKEMEEKERIAREQKRLVQVPNTRRYLK